MTVSCVLFRQGAKRKTPQSPFRGEFRLPTPTCGLAFRSARAQRVDSPELGRLLGYPACCIEGYGEIVRGRPWVEKLIDAPSNSPYSVFANKLGYLFRGSPSFLPDYYPCSLACGAAAALGRENYLGLREFGLDSLAESMKSKLSRPIVYLPSLLAQLTKSYRVGDEIHFEPATVAYYESGFPDGRRLFAFGRIRDDATELDGYPCRLLTFVEEPGLHAS